MIDDAVSAREELAFIHSLVDDTGRSQTAFGVAYFSAGLVYTAQMVVAWAQSIGALTLSSTRNEAVVANIVVIGVWLGTYLRWRTTSANLATRAVNAAFIGVAATAVTLCAICAEYAARAHSMEPWLMFAPVGFALQGGAWTAAFLLRRRAWLLLVAAGWFSTALLCGWLGARPVVALTYAAGFFLWMAAPGAAVLVLARRGI